MAEAQGDATNTGDTRDTNDRSLKHQALPSTFAGGDLKEAFANLSGRANPYLPVPKATAVDQSETQIPQWPCFAVTQD